jgi:Bacterial Ig-like domain/Kelch motif
MTAKTASTLPYGRFYFRFFGTTCLFLLIFVFGCKKGKGYEQINPTYTGNLIPSVITTIPARDSIGISPETDISVFFNTAMDSSTIDTSTFIVQAGNTNVPGAIKYNKMAAVFVPSARLIPKTTYTVEITNRVKNSSGIFLNSNFIWNFTTEDTSYYKMSQRSTAVTDFKRDGSKMMQMGEYLYSYGGWTATPAQTYNDVYRSSGDLLTWTKLPNAPWTGRHTFGIAKIDSVLYVLGGDYFNNVFDVWSSTNGTTWEERNDGRNNFLGNRILYGACSHNGKLYVLGGQDGVDPPSKTFTDVWSSTDGIKWEQIANGEEFLGKNISGVCTSFDGKIWVVGGGLYDYNAAPIIRWTNEIWNSTDGIVWEQQPAPPWEGRQYADVCVWDNKLWMIGGIDGANLAEIWYLTKTGTWTQFVPPPSYISRHATAVAVFNDQLVITCGNYNNDCWVIEKQ